MTVQIIGVENLECTEPIQPLISLHDYAERSMTLFMLVQFIGFKELKKHEQPTPYMA